MAILSEQIDRKKPSFLKKLFRRFLILLFLGGLLIWFAPNMVAATNLRNVVANWIFSDLRGEITMSSASLGWFMPVKCYEVEIRNENGEILAQAPTVVSDKTLLELLLNLQQLGTFEIKNSILTVQLTEESSTLEEAIHAYVYPDPDLPASDPFAVAVRLIDANVKLLAVDRKTSWSLAMSSADIAYDPTVKRWLDIKWQGQMEQGKGQTSGTLVWDNQEKSELMLNAQSKNLPLAMMNGMIRRVDHSVDLKGDLTTDVKCQYIMADSDSIFKVSGDLAVAELDLACSQLGKDRLQLQKVNMPCAFTLHNKSLEIEKVSLDSDVGRLSLKGTFPIDGELSALMKQPNCTVDGKIDLVELAKRLPKTLHIKEGVEITRGEVELALASHQGTDRVLWQGTLTTTPLEARAEGKQLAWPDPIKGRFSGYLGQNEWPVFDEFVCSASFLEVKVGSKGNQLQATASYDLEKLIQRLEQFVDFGAIRLAGNGMTTVSLETAKNNFQLVSSTQLSGLKIQGLSKQAIVEPSLSVTVLADGDWDLSGKGKITFGNVNLQAGQDQVTASLLAPVTMEQMSNDMQLSLTGKGDIQRWVNRLQPVLPSLEGIQLAGTTDLGTRLHVKKDALILSNGEGVWRNAQVKSSAMSINEPEIRLQTSGQISRITGDLKLTGAQFRTNQVVMNAQEVLLTSKKAELRNATCQGELASLQNWFGGTVEEDRQIKGQFSGQLNCLQQNEELNVDFAILAKNVFAGPRQNPIWQEKELRLDGKGKYLASKDRFDLVNFQYYSELIQCHGSAGLNNLSTNQEVHATGKVAYNMNRLEPILQSMLGNSVRVSGSGERPFELSGSLASLPAAGKSPANGNAALTGDFQGRFGTHWDQFQIFGFVADKAEIQGQLNKGYLQFAPIATALNGGKLNVQPTFYVGAQGLDLYFPKGKMIDHAQITPQMCASAIKYAVPALAGMSEGQGEISLDMAGAKIPFADINKTDMGGVFTIHDVRITASPLIRELSQMLKQPAEVRLAKESNVPFRVINGRVYHEKMELIFRDTTIRTKGWVGLDGTLQLTAEFAIPDRWLGDNFVGKALENRMVTIPIQGTLDRPRLDQRGLLEATQRLIRDAARDRLEQELQNRLKNLFNKKN